jgi:hypothetical protein
MADSQTTGDWCWGCRQPLRTCVCSSGQKRISISARLYEELKDYLVMETDMTAGNLLRRLRESNNG